MQVRRWQVDVCAGLDVTADQAEVLTYLDRSQAPYSVLVSSDLRRKSIGLQGSVCVLSSLEDVSSEDLKSGCGLMCVNVGVCQYAYVEFLAHPSQDTYLFLHSKPTAPQWWIYNQCCIFVIICGVILDM